MASFKTLITGVTKGIKLPAAVVDAQRLAAALAWQITHDYPNRTSPSNWRKYGNLRGAMLADEVGGGKTFETLAIISKALLSNHRRRLRVLVIVNPAIRSKWEWLEESSFTDFLKHPPQSEIGKFIQQTKISIAQKEKLFRYFSGQEVFKSKSDWANVRLPRKSFCLCSFGSLPKTTGYNVNSVFVTARRKSSFPKNAFDWVIVDEAHGLKSGSKDVDERIKLDNSAVRKIHAVLNANLLSKVLLLSATPFQNNHRELQHLLSILEYDSKLSGSFTGIITSAILSLERKFEEVMKSVDEASLRELKQCISTDINALLGQHGHQQRPLILGGVLKNGLQHYFKDIMVRNTKTSLSTQLTPHSLSPHAQLQYLLFRDLVKDIEGEATMFSTKLSQLVSSKESFLAGFRNHKNYRVIENLFKKNLVAEEKTATLLALIGALTHAKGKFVITVYVSWISTIEMLRTRLENAGYNVYTFTGYDKVKDRRAKLEKLMSANKASASKIILLASRVGNEGLDFDAFSNRVIHYDNNFNPAVIDQRNGRVYRGTNVKSTNNTIHASDIEIRQLYLEGTYDQRIVFIEKEKRKFKNFYLGDDSVQAIFQQALSKDDLGDKKKLIRLVESIKIDLTPTPRDLFAKYQREIR